MQPHRRGDEAESKASCSVDKGPGKGAGGEQCKIEGLKLAHGIPQLSPPRSARRAMGQRLACYSWGVVAWDLALSMGMTSSESTGARAELASAAR